MTPRNLPVGQTWHFDPNSRKNRKLQPTVLLPAELKFLRFKN